MKNYFSGRRETCLETPDWPDNELASSEQTFAEDYFRSLIGGEYDYFGCDHHQFKLDGVIFEPIPDPDDGYRSHLGTMEVSTSVDSVFFKRPIAKVRIEVYDTGDTFDENTIDDMSTSGVDKGYRLVDVSDGHVWLQFGTGNYDDYYPYFEFRHYPKEAPSCLAR